VSDAVRRAWRSFVASPPRRRAGPIGVLDIGTSKICCYIVRTQPGQGVELLGRGYQLAEGLRAGEIIDTEAAETALLAVIHEAEQQAGHTLRELVVAVGGCQPVSTWHRLTLPLNGRRVTAEDVTRLLERARWDADEPERTLLHLLPLEFSLDGGPALGDPRGLMGESLDLLAHAVTVSSQPLRNILDCLERCHLDVRAVVSASYASGIACLAPEEMERGCIVLDLGGGITSLVHFIHGRLALVEQVPYGGENVTRDLAWGLSTSHEHAERIKNLYGGVQWRTCDDNLRLEVPLIGDHPDLPTGEVPRTRITQIIRARVEEILLLAQDRLREHLDFLQTHPPRGLVLTGGGSQLEGIDELAHEMFSLPVRRGRPSMIRGAQGPESEPCCATATGAVALALGEDMRLVWARPAETAFLAAPLARVGRWLRESF
jgi:cell division protein FtsA